MLTPHKALFLYTVVATAAVSAFAVAPANAQSEPFVVTARPIDLPVRRVGYGDLNLTLASHRVALINRVDNAVTRVCLASGHNIDKTLEARASHRDCNTLAWSGARPQLAAAINRAWAARAHYGTGAPWAGAAITVAAPIGF
jgi:UrcA family protein